MSMPENARFLLEPYRRRGILREEGEVRREEFGMSKTGGNEVMTDMTDKSLFI
jgi:hypothetical protein